MRIAAIKTKSGPTLAIQFGELLLNINRLAAHFSLSELVSPMDDLISDVIENAARQQALAKLQQLLAEQSEAQPETQSEAWLSDFVIRDLEQWLPPVKRPGKILGVAMNNKASDERKISAPSHPAFFLKPASCLIGHEQAIEVRDYYGSAHPEPELALIIGKRVKDVSAEEAWDAIYGYTVFNDITGNDMRAEDRFHYWALYPKQDDPDQLERREQHLSYAARYKGTDGFGPMGPWVVTADEVPDPHNLSVRCWHKDQLIAEDSTAYMNYKANEIIEFISRFQTLEPGDVISLGTAFRPQEGSKRCLHLANITRLGGPVSVEIEGIGRLENPVIQR